MVSLPSLSAPVRSRSSWLASFVQPEPLGPRLPVQVPAAYAEGSEGALAVDALGAQRAETCT